MGYGHVGVGDYPCLLLLFAFFHGDGSKENSNAASISIHRRYQLPPPSPPPPSTSLPSSSSPQLSTTADKKKELVEAPLFEVARCTRRSITLQKTKLIPVEQLLASFVAVVNPEKFEFNDVPVYSPLFVILFPFPFDLSSFCWSLAYLSSRRNKLLAWLTRVLVLGERACMG